MKKIIFWFLLGIILSSCGNEAPVITFPMYHILIYQGGSLNIPNDSIFLSVHFILQDDNGMDDISEIKITHSETEYSWVLPKESLSSTTLWQEKTYTSYSFLEYENAKSILTGEYLIEVEDKAANFAQTVFFVEIEGLISSEPFKLPDIDYKVVATNKNNEIKISKDDYSSCEIRFLNDSKYFNGGRKKFKKNQKIILNNNNPMPINTKVSVRINKDEDETMVYFLKTLVLE